MELWLAVFRVETGGFFARADGARHMSIAPTVQTNRTAKFIASFLLPHSGRRIWIFSEGFIVSLSQNFHHPAVEVIHRMIENRAKAAIVFLTGLIEITTQPMTDILVFTAQANVLWPQKLDVLHAYFSSPICAAVQFLQFG